MQRGPPHSAFLPRAGLWRPLPPQTAYLCPRCPRPGWGPRPRAVPPPPASRSAPPAAPRVRGRWGGVVSPDLGAVIVIPAASRCGPSPGRNPTPRGVDCGWRRGGGGARRGWRVAAGAGAERGAGGGGAGLGAPPSLPRVVSPRGALERNSRVLFSDPGQKLATTAPSPWEPNGPPCQASSPPSVPFFLLVSDFPRYSCLLSSLC